MPAPTIEQVKAYLKYELDDNDPALEIMLAAGKEWVEGYTDFDMAAAEEVPAVMVFAICLFCAMSDEDRATQSSSGWAAIRTLLAKHHKPPVA